MLDNIRKLFKLKSYVYGYLYFLKKLKAYNSRIIYIAVLLGTFTLLDERLGVSILVPLLSYIQVDGDIEKFKSFSLISLYFFNFLNFFGFKINVLLLSFIVIVFILFRQVLDFLNLVIIQKITIILIPHRVLSFMNTDHIISIHNGKVEYEGKPNNFKRGII